MDLHQIKQIELHYIYLHALKSQQPPSNIHVIHWLLAGADLPWVESRGPDVLYLDWHICTMGYLLNHSALSDIKSLRIGISCKSNNQIRPKSSRSQASPWPTNIFCSKLQWPCSGGMQLQFTGHPNDLFLFLFSFFSMTWQACLYYYVHAPNLVVVDYSL